MILLMIFKINSLGLYNQYKRIGMDFQTFPNMEQTKTGFERDSRCTGKE